MRQTIMSLLLVSMSLFCSCNGKDESIASSIQQKISADPQIQSAQVVVVVKGGKVTLKGRAKTSVDRERIEHIAKTEPGVWTVDDQIISDARSSESAGGTATSPPAVSKVVVVPAGTILTIRTAQPLGSKTSQVGTVFNGRLASPIKIRGSLIIPSGTSVAGSVKQAKKAARFRGGALLELGLHSITVSKQTYNIDTEMLLEDQSGKSKAVRTKTGTGADAVGPATGKRDIDLPAESAVSFRLVQPLKVVVVVR